MFETESELCMGEVRQPSDGNNRNKMKTQGAMQMYDCFAHSDNRVKQKIVA